MHQKFLSYKFIDSSGNLRDKIVRKENKGDLKPTWFDGSSFGFRETSNSDLMLVPDKDSQHYDPIRDMNSYFCFLYDAKTQPLEECFRNQVKKAMDQDDQTQGALFGVEPEFFICKQDGVAKPMPVGVSSGLNLKEVKQYKWYGSLPPVDVFQDLRFTIADKLEAAGLVIEGIHHEVAPGQCEFSWKCGNLLRICDQFVLFKYIVSNICVQNNLIAMFEAKPFPNLNGNGCHVHQSIPAMSRLVGSDKTYRPHFEKDEEVIEAYAQGLIDHYDELLSVCCIGDTSMDRLVPGFEAPTKENNGFGYCDRTKTVRIPGGGRRLEFRLPDPSMNPYVALPMMLKFGYDNVRKVANDRHTDESISGTT